ncbi:hypothetical protein [Streptomyces sp. NPDC002573]|uniref:hypothetical protein n=1 Tax=Streptomyces sp. NPDC002573 TaxID=3364651 RepID=UPI0036D0D498
MNRIRLYLHRLFRRPAITGPMRLYTRRVPDGVFLDLEEYLVHVIETLADDPDAYALFLELADDRSVSREHDGWEPEKLLMEKLALVVGYEVPVRGAALTRLVGKLRAAAPAATVVAVPAQRGAGAA